MNLKNDQKLLTIYDSLPSLLDIATERAKETDGNAYDIQNDLMIEYHENSTPFRWSMPYRSLFECFRCGYLSTEIQHSLYNPNMKDVDPTLYSAGLSEGDLHRIREHGTAFSAEVQRFLMQLTTQSV